MRFENSVSHEKVRHVDVSKDLFGENIARWAVDVDRGYEVVSHLCPYNTQFAGSLDGCLKDQFGDDDGFIDIEAEYVKMENVIHRQKFYRVMADVLRTCLSEAPFDHSKLYRFATEGARVLDERGDRVNGEVPSDFLNRQIDSVSMNIMPDSGGRTFAMLTEDTIKALYRMAWFTAYGAKTKEDFDPKTYPGESERPMFEITDGVAKVISQATSRASREISLAQEVAGGCLAQRVTGTTYIVGNIFVHVNLSALRIPSKYFGKLAIMMASGLPLKDVRAPMTMHVGEVVCPFSNLTVAVDLSATDRVADSVRILLNRNKRIAEQLPDAERIADHLNSDVARRK